MIILKHSCFLHIPKTGGTWVREAIKLAGLEYEEIDIAGDIHLDLSQCPCPGKYKFAFVRNPIALYRSYWQYKMGSGWDINNPLDKSCCSANFHEFVENVLQQHPGICSRTFEAFVGPEDSPIEYIGKCENLREDLLSALRAAGEVFDEEAIRRCPPINVSEKHSFPARLTPELENRIRASEKDGFRRFSYPP